MAESLHIHGTYTFRQTTVTGYLTSTDVDKVKVKSAYEPSGPSASTRSISTLPWMGC